MTDAGGYRELGEAGWAWVLGQVREDDGPWLPESVADDGPPGGPAGDRDSLYAGIAGLAPVLAEVERHRALTDAERSLAAGIVNRLSAGAAVRAEPSLSDGLAGDVVALRLLAPGRGGSRCAGSPSCAPRRGGTPPWTSGRTTGGHSPT